MLVLAEKKSSVPREGNGEKMIEVMTWVGASAL